MGSEFQYLSREQTYGKKEKWLFLSGHTVPRCMKRRGPRRRTLFCPDGHEIHVKKERAGRVAFSRASICRRQDIDVGKLRKEAEDSFSSLIYRLNVELYCVKSVH